MAPRPNHDKGGGQADDQDDERGALDVVNEHVDAAARHIAHLELLHAGVGDRAIRPVQKAAAVELYVLLQMTNQIKRRERTSNSIT